MEHDLVIYNTLKRKKERFVPLHPPFVGMYVCGPTVYGDAHLGHARPAITFDVLFRYLKRLGYEVRYVRNITDVGHLVDDADEGEDKIARAARAKKLEPMEVARHYTIGYHKNMEQLNTLPPGIEPLASGHIIEQQELVKKIIANGLAYESNGSVYFDVKRYDREHAYGKLSGRRVDELESSARHLEGQEEKRDPLDFALWKKAAPGHLMHWPSPWGEGFPGWHVECSCMSQKYLGETFDIHGGGLDLVFPHHECEIAQSTAANGHEAVRYWMHNNMITINGQKMGKSLGNFITLDQLFSGENDVLDQAYSPMTVRFFILQAHYRSPLDFSNDALKAARKGYERLLSAIAALDRATPAGTGNVAAEEIDALERDCRAALDDDLNTPVLLARLFDGTRLVQAIAAGTREINAANLARLQRLYRETVIDILGLKQETTNDTRLLGKVIDMLMDVREKARQEKDWKTSDRIRDELKQAGIIIKDTKEGHEWHVENNH
ncbi:MAG: cysteine--tRNA ligase [Odoribacteraceae bacterium]|jgi:cysteinyl-tRNA synthetase|nr:cysteine--tRNA ligase [Odoribacteraceae bacterium]